MRMKGTLKYIIEECDMLDKQKIIDKKNERKKAKKQ